MVDSVKDPSLVKGARLALDNLSIMILDRGDRIERLSISLHDNLSFIRRVMDEIWYLCSESDLSNLSETADDLVVQLRKLKKLASLGEEIFGEIIRVINDTIEELSKFEDFPHGQD